MSLIDNWFHQELNWLSSLAWRRDLSIEIASSSTKTRNDMSLSSRVKRGDLGIEIASPSMKTRNDYATFNDLGSDFSIKPSANAIALDIDLFSIPCITARFT
jgi:hypothetical protein